jgi:hypothetical protein
MAYDTSIRQHKNLAMGDGTMKASDCGCDSLAKVNGGIAHPDAGMSHTPLDDSNRAGPPHISRGGGKLPATAHSDHGPHHIPS